MLRTLSAVARCKVTATDGDIGTVSGFLFDDEQWVVRYFVVETGGFAGGRKLLVSPIAIRKALIANRVLQAGLTVDKVQYGPNPDLGELISREQERDYNRYYGYSAYWEHRGPWGAGVHPGALASARKDEALADGAAETGSVVHLKTDGDLRGCFVEGADGVIGRVADFVVDEETWQVRYLVVETDAWRPGQEVLIPPAWTERTVLEPTLKLSVSREAVASCPVWSQPLNQLGREYEASLHAHYQRKGYWEVPE